MDTAGAQQRAWLALLPHEPQVRSKLALLYDRIGDEADVNLVLDLSRMEIIRLASLRILLAPHDRLSRQGRKVILCKTRLIAQRILRSTGLRIIFHFAGDKVEALRMLGQSSWESAGHLGNVALPSLL